MGMHYSRPVTEIRFFHPRADRVCVIRCGEWPERTASPMLGAADGEWLCHVVMAEGDYQFRYRVNGTWYRDDARIRVGRGPRRLRLTVAVGNADPPGIRESSPRRQEPVQPDCACL